MQFTASTERVMLEKEIQEMVSIIIDDLKLVEGYSIIHFWEKEFLEWFLDRKIEYKDYGHSIFEIKLYQHITEDELKQLEQLRDYLEL